MADTPLSKLIVDLVLQTTKFQEGSEDAKKQATKTAEETTDEGDVGQAYDEQWVLENCGTSVTITLTSGSLPPGTSLSALGTNGGQISGTPATAAASSSPLHL